MVEIEGKREREVPLLLMPDIKNEANTNPNNKFFFTRLSEDSIHHIPHRDCLTKQCRGLEVKEPNFIVPAIESMLQRFPQC